MSATESLFFYDLETWGTDPARDRIAQFAGQRTDLNFELIDDPVNLLCRPTWDTLPAPAACQVTGLCPQDTLDGLCEHDFAAAIEGEFRRPGTCVLGYNSLRFDDEFLRHLFYRNLRDPYAREWRDGCSRWDLLDAVRLCRALRPAGIEWPLGEDGSASNRLEALAAANSLDHKQAHDALSDVRATIALARLLRARQPKLYDYAFSHRDKRSAAALLDPAQRRSVLHVSGMLPAAQGHAALVLPLAHHPDNRNAVIACDLGPSPLHWSGLSATELAQRLFTRAGELPAGVARPPLKLVHLNRCPVLAPASVLDPASAERLGIDPARAAAHREQLLAVGGLPARLQRAFASPPPPPPDDPDLQLYAGGFIGAADRRQLDALLAAVDNGGAWPPARYQDSRLTEMVRRFRARNWPDTLSDAERRGWREAVRQRLRDPALVATTRAAFERQVAAMAIEPAQRALAESLLRWRDTLLGEGEATAQDQ